MKVENVYNQGIGKQNEDQLLIQDNLFAVFDGATDLTGYTDEEGNSGGYLAAQIAKAAFSSNDKSLVELAKQANLAILRKMAEKKVDITDKVNLWNVNLAVVRVNVDKIEWLVMPDSAILLIDSNGKFQLPAKIIKKDLSSMEKLKARGKYDKKYKYHVPIELIQQGRRETNITHGALNGEEEMINFLQTGKIETKKFQHVLLFTDGLFLPKKDPTENEDWNMMVEMFLSGGLKNVLEYVRKEENRDSDCLKYPRFKKHDDIAAIAITF